LVIRRFTQRNDLPGTISRLVNPPCQIQTYRVIAKGAALKMDWERGATLGRQPTRKNLVEFRQSAGMN
jgi:hypothetical protein